MPYRRRALNPRLIKRDLTYTVDEIAQLYAIHANTVRHWLAGGLHPIDSRRPILIHGGDLIAYLRKKRSVRRVRCELGEFYCFKCRDARRPRASLVIVKWQSERLCRLIGHCDVCGTQMFKAASVRTIPIYEGMFILQSTPSEHITVCASPVLDCDLEREEET